MSSTIIIEYYGVYLSHGVQCASQSRRIPSVSAPHLNVALLPLVSGDQANMTLSCPVRPRLTSGSLVPHNII